MNEIERLLRRGFNPKRLAAAAHQVGHGYGYLGAGLRPTMLRLDIGWFGRVNGGGVWLGYHEVTPRQRTAYLVGVLAGHAAHARFLHRYTGAELHTARRMAEPAAEHDYERLFDLTAEWGTRPSVSDLYAKAERLVTRAGTRIDRATPVLARAGRLSGGAL